MINNPNVVSSGGGELATVTIHGPRGTSPTQSLVYLHGGSVDYVDVSSNSTNIIHVDLNTFIVGATLISLMTENAQEKSFGERNTKVIVVTGDCEIRFKF